jgi:hypothetical protein
MAASTNVKVAVFGSSASDGTIATVFSANLGSQPPGTASTSLNNPQFYDAKVSGISDGNANICVSNGAADSSTQLQYYSSGAWIAATNATSTAGVGVCGNVPVSILTGTYLALGGSNSSSSMLQSPLLYLGVGVVAVIILAGVILLRRQRSGK